MKMMLTHTKSIIELERKEINYIKENRVKFSPQKTKNLQLVDPVKSLVIWGTWTAGT